ncbi:MAG: SoxR reducing system RseC family protein [Granulosicoccus sp.]
MRVVSVANASESRKVLVELDAKVACRRCASGAGCGAGRLSPDSRAIQIHVQDRLGVVPGDLVIIDVPEGDGSGWLWLVLAAFSLPTLGIVLGASLPYALWAILPGMRISGIILGLPAAEWAVALAAAAGLAGGVLAWRKVAPALGRLATHSVCLDSARTIRILQL